MERHSTGRLLAIVAVLLALSPGLALADPPPPQAKVHPMLWETLQAEGEAEVLVILEAQAELSGAEALHTKEDKGRYVYETLRTVAETTQQGLRATLDAQAVEYQSFFIVNAIHVRAGSGQVRALAARSDVSRIVPNPWVKGIPPAESTLSGAGVPKTGSGVSLQAASPAPSGIEPNLARVNADDVWALGYTGQGVVVAGQDTGYDWDHPALKNQYRGWDGARADHDYNWHDAIHSWGGSCGPDALEPCDDSGHGTHTMGTIVGHDGGGHQIGMAPGAKWIGCRNMDVGYGTPVTYLECFEFFLAPYPVAGTPAQGDPALAPHVVSNSWSCPPSEGCDPSTLEVAVESLRQAGIAVVVSAGNSGPSCGIMSNPPAIYQQSFTVGGLDHRDDSVYARSSRGPVTYGGDTYTKPDISAPAVSVNSSLPGGGYGFLTGTSMAAPHVAGAVALLLSAAPAYSGKVDAVEQTLTRTAEPRLDGQCGHPGPPNSVWGWGILDAQTAVEAATSGLLHGTVTDASTGTPIGDARVATRLATGPVGPETRTYPTGLYTMTLAADTYDVTFQAPGYRLQMMASLQVTETTNLDLALVPFYRFYIPLVATSP